MEAILLEIFQRKNILKFLIVLEFQSFIYLPVLSVCLCNSTFISIQCHDSVQFDNHLDNEDTRRKILMKREERLSRRVHIIRQWYGVCHICRHKEI